ncbi:enoyl-CoA hydratase [Erythrobacter sp. HI0063]|mgnify:FL=1|jgi:enoyl-CoA hydratase/carnithine racemase|uniref:enoyl-CoA hydratase-related protein n=1 Tax=Erythrobacter sp. HI0063 TaxID=1822240 RepID=UPI0007C2CF86|nr:enoyl-CoA hydratase-related protein [Erythrobacter sp. HI0063]KZY57206.1 enoyl-CoA hydratase [Erythrobacter sp. HI0063]
MTPSDQEIVQVERDGAVALVRLNRPEKHNALDLAMRRALAKAVEALVAEDGIRAIVIAGSDTVFAAGADLSLLAEKGAQEVANLALPSYWAPLVHCPKPLFAAVNGVALGAGCELALLCDVIVADRGAAFGQPELGVGIMPGAGGTQRLIRAVGKSVAGAMLYAGERLSGERAHALGLVAVLTEQGMAVDAAMALARRAAHMPARAVAATKRTLALGADLPLEAALALENREFLLLFDTWDKSEGMTAFLEKRRPEFRGC